MTPTGFCLKLPVPPSVNRYWRMYVGRMLVSREGKAYQKHVMLAKQIAGTPRLTGRLEVGIVYHPCNFRRRDIDNLPKAILDSLMYAGCYEDDSQIDRLTVERGEMWKDDPCIVVTVSQIMRVAA